MGAVMFCPECGSENPEGARFCKDCGSGIPQIEEMSPAMQPAAQPFQQPVEQTAQQWQVQPEQQWQAQQVQQPEQQWQAQSFQQPERQWQAPQLNTPTITGPTYAPASAGAYASTSSQKPLKIALIALIAIAVIAVAVVAVKAIMSGSSAANGHRLDTSFVLDSSGKRVDLLNRPVLATLPDVADGLGATPGLASYVEDSLGSSAQTTKFGNSVVVTASGEEPKVTNSYGSVNGPTPSSGLSNVTNLSDFSLNDEEKKILEKNMFVVDARYGNLEFFDVYEGNRYSQEASFITTDSIMHTYHLYFAHLLKNLEANQLYDNLSQLTNTMLEKSLEQQAALKGTEWDTAASRNVDFFALAQKLLNPNAQPPASAAGVVESEYNKIMAASGMNTSAFTGEPEDYTQYKPRGYYEGNEKLERYFRAMMLYGRTHFLQTDSLGTGDDLNRSALLINLALDDGSHSAANKDWESIYTITSFFAGASDDCGFYEYFPLIQAAYGNEVKVSDLPGNAQAWQKYQDLTSKVRAPQISSLIVGDEEAVDQDDLKGFRFMGQRFSLDASIFQQLVHDNVSQRLLPSALDVPAALGSDAALEILKENGAANYTGYTEQMEAVRKDIANAGDDVWQGSLYAQWLYTLNPLLVSKDDTFPAFMTSNAWDRKNLQTYQGSYTELKHDTILYSKQVLAEMGGGPLNHDERGYVEPEPELYARLGNLAQATVSGLEQYGAISEKDKSEMQLLQDICTKLKTMSEKELAGTELNNDEYEFIKTYGGQLEHFWVEVNASKGRGLSASTLSPAAIVADVATDATNGTCLELGIGKVNSIYVLVPINGELHVTRGAVFSDYEFVVPISDRMTDSTWRQRLGIGSTSSSSSSSAPAMVPWVSDFTVTK